MQAALGRRVDNAFGHSISIPSTPAVAGSAVYAVAAIELYSRLWQALEDLTSAFARCGANSSETGQQLILLRLELVVLLDTFESARCRSMLRPHERAQLRTTVHGQLDALWVQPEAGGPALMRAQNQLLDAVLKLLWHLQG